VTDQADDRFAELREMPDGAEIDDVLGDWLVDFKDSLELVDADVPAREGKWFTGDRPVTTENPIGSTAEFGDTRALDQIYRTYGPAAIRKTARSVDELGRTALVALHRLGAAENGAWVGVEAVARMLLAQADPAAEWVARDAFRLLQERGLLELSAGELTFASRARLTRLGGAVAAYVDDEQSADQIA
jgi:hypothetical protein